MNYPGYAKIYIHNPEDREPERPTKERLRALLHEAWARIPEGGGVTTEEAVERIREIRHGSD